MRAVRKADAGDATVGSFECLHRGVEQDANAVGLVASLNEIRQQGGGNACQHACFSLDHSDIDAHRAGGGGGFQPNVASTDDREAQTRPQRRLEAIGVGDAAELVNAGEAASWHWQHPRPHAERQDQMIVGDALAGLDHQCPVGAVDDRCRR